MRCHHKSESEESNSKLQLLTSQPNSVDLTFITFPALDMTHLHNWQHLYLPFNPRWRAIQPIMITSQCPSPLPSCHMANHLRPETRPQTDKTKTTAKTFDRWSANILLAFLSNWQFEETRATCHCSQDFQQKKLAACWESTEWDILECGKTWLGSGWELGKVTWVSCY